MTTISCSSCGRDCSTRMIVCPDCGTPVGYTGAEMSKMSQEISTGLPDVAIESSPQDGPPSHASNDSRLLRVVIAIAFSLPVSVLLVIDAGFFADLIVGQSRGSDTAVSWLLLAVWLIGWAGVAFHASRAEAVRNVVRRTAVIYAWGAFAMPFLVIISMLIRCGGPAGFLFCLAFGFPDFIASVLFGLITGAMGVLLAHFLGKQS